MCESPIDNMAYCVFYRDLHVRMFSIINMIYRQTITEIYTRK